MSAIPTTETTFCPLFQGRIRCDDMSPAVVRVDIRARAVIIRRRCACDSPLDISIWGCSGSVRQSNGTTRPARCKNLCQWPIYATRFQCEFSWRDLDVGRKRTLCDCMRFCRQSNTSATICLLAWGTTRKRSKKVRIPGASESINMTKKCHSTAIVHWMQTMGMKENNRLTGTRSADRRHYSLRFLAGKLSNSSTWIPRGTRQLASRNRVGCATFTRTNSRHQAVNTGPVTMNKSPDLAYRTLTNYRAPL